jgi:hypothetical protein
MVRRMADQAFRIEQEHARYASHVRPINEMVDGLRDPAGRGWMPYVAPWQAASRHGCCRCCVIPVR